MEHVDDLMEDISLAVQLAPIALVDQSMIGFNISPVDSVDPIAYMAQWITQTMLVMTPLAP